MDETKVEEEVLPVEETVEETTTEEVTEMDASGNTEEAVA